MYRITVIFWFIFPKPPHISCWVATEILHVFLVVLGLLFLAVLDKHHQLFFLSSYSFPSSSPGKTFLRAPQMNINIATWGRLVRRAIPTVSTNSFSPQAAETGPSSLPGSPTPSRYSHAHTWTKDINMSLLIHKNYKKGHSSKKQSSAHTQWPTGDQAGLRQRAHPRTQTLPGTRQHPRTTGAGQDAWQGGSTGTVF